MAYSQTHGGEQTDPNIQEAIASVIHEIQNHLHIIMMELDLLRISDDKSAGSRRAVHALEAVARSIHELQSISRRLTKSPAAVEIE
jgi:hypothetical protein